MVQLDKKESIMVVSVNQFRSNLKHYVDQSIDAHEPLTVSRKNGEDFVVLSLDDYSRVQETLYVLENKTLMNQIKASIKTHKKADGYTPSLEELGLDV